MTISTAKRFHALLVMARYNQDIERVEHIKHILLCFVSMKQVQAAKQALYLN